ncbi:MAG TPA: hypothetical protein PKA27_11175 [Fimbriimonadaceae bacterium]|nr:hypothetical protein [Fimbriimonadaceae bacterium]
MKKALMVSWGILAALSAQAQFAKDDAMDSTYVIGQEYIQVGTPPGDQTAATNGKNGGFGFNAWQRGGYGSPPFFGTTLITNVSPSFNMGAQQFGLRSATDGSEGADARRRLFSDLEVGQILSFSMMPGGGGAGQQNSRGDMGAEIRGASLSNPGRDMVTINGSNGQNYSILDSVGYVFTDIPVTPGVRVDVQVRQTAIGTIEIKMKPWGGATRTYVKTSISSGVKIRTVQFYCFETDGDFYVNFLDAKNPPATPAGYVVTSGEEFEGDLSSLLSSDNNRLTMFNDPTSLAASVEVFANVAAVPTRSYKVTVETSVARPGLAQSVALRNYTTNSFQVVDGSVATTSDTVREVLMTTSAAAYVSGALQVRIRLSWSPINDEDPAQDGWLHNVDQVLWNVD